MLIFIGIGGIYLLEHKHISGQKPFPDSPGIYHAGMNPGILTSDREPEGSVRGTSMHGKPGPRKGSVVSPSHAHSLGDLGFHIEL